MNKPECDKRYNKHKRVVSDENCNDCSFLYECRYVQALIDKIVYGDKSREEKTVKYDPNMPCNKKGCDASTRASCCGCPEQLEYERKKKQNKNVI